MCKADLQLVAELKIPRSTTLIEKLLDVSQPFFHVGTAKIIVHIAKNPFLRKTFTGQKT
jgi:hypothetical protein